MNAMRFLSFLLFSAISLGLWAQSPEPVNGVREPKNTIYALRNGIIHTASGEAFSGNIIIRDKIILNVSTDEQMPEGAVVIDLKGKHVYPGFVEAWSTVGFDPVHRAGRRQEIMFRNNDGTGDWNMAIQPEFDASMQVKYDEKLFKSYREAGFTTICSHRDDGIMQGTGIIFNTGEGNLNELTIRNRGARFFSFNKGSSPMDYPSSLMGSIALFRQTLLDLDWYQRGGKLKYANRSLEALNETAGLPSIFKSSSWRDVLRIDNLRKESGINFIALESGDSYQRAEEIARAGVPLFLTLNYPEAWNVKDASATQHISWDDMQHFETAPANAELLRRKGILFGLSSAGLKSPGEFMKALTKAVRAGLPASEALKAATETPAKLLGIWNETGSIENGKYANLFISSDTLFSDDWRMEMCFVSGKLFYVENPELSSISGEYNLRVGSKNIPATIQTKEGKINIEFKDSLAEIKSTAELSGKRFDFSIKEKGDYYLYRFNGNISAGNGEMRITGRAYPVQGKPVEFTLEKTSDRIIKPADPNKPELFTADDFIERFPFHAFGNDSLPEQETILFQGATIWTCDKDREPFIGDVLVNGGKIIACSEKINPAEFKIKDGFRTINATGKHITPGIIDEHSHIAIERGVNEGSQNNTAEVRISDAVNGEDPAIFYQLMGGVTSAQLLHGSANPIGGQSAVIKLRWGETPEGLINKNAPGHIKFALGENVKQSNWGDSKRYRFPQTRMGVEQVYYDAFQRTKEYIKAKEKIADKKNKYPELLRKDLELEALEEILRGKRFITCHSYVQSEVNMLLHVADSMGFKVNTFTHILEGYKVADKLAAHGANASTFSDWWAYKFEVNDAIPYNAAILTRMGVNTGINSDDAEMGRRLNQEAAKAILYGGLSEPEALKLVTINPAKMLHIDNYTGSLVAGKDADLVLWSDNPLSVQARAEITMIDGKIYFDLSKHEAKLTEIDSLRNNLIKNILLEKPEEGRKLREARKKPRHQYHCDDLYNGLIYEEEMP